MIRRARTLICGAASSRDLGNSDRLFGSQVYGTAHAAEHVRSRARIIVQVQKVKVFCDDGEAGRH